MDILKKLKERITPPKVNISISLKKQFFSPGDVVEGSLNIDSQEEFDSTEIRCELECSESVRSKKGVYNAVTKRYEETDVWETKNFFQQEHH